MIKSLVSTISLVLFCLAIYAQQPNQFCGTITPNATWENEFQKIILDLIEEKNLVKESVKENKVRFATSFSLKDSNSS